jgi:hypothetical protein
MSDRQSPWTLVQAKRYDEAADAYATEFAETGRNLALRGRAKARLLAGQVQAAKTDFQQVIESTDPKLRDDSSYIHLGICHWYLHNPKEAVAAWRESLSTPYADGAGGACPSGILFYAAIRLQDQVLHREAITSLRKHWQRHMRRVRRGQPKTSSQAHDDFVHPGLYAWPGAIVPFLLGKTGQEALDRAAQGAPVDILRIRQQCQADFVAGARALHEGDQPTFRDRMARSASSIYGELEDEFCLARWEVINNFPEAPF